MPDLQLAVGPLQNPHREKQDKRCRLFDPLQHPVLGEVRCPVVVPRLEAHPLELEVDGICLVSAGGL